MIYRICKYFKFMSLCREYTQIHHSSGTPVDLMKMLDDALSGDLPAARDAFRERFLSVCMMDKSIINTVQTYNLTMDELRKIYISLQTLPESVLLTTSTSGGVVPLIGTLFYSEPLTFALVKMKECKESDPKDPLEFMRMITQMLFSYFEKSNTKGMFYKKTAGNPYFKG